MTKPLTHVDMLERKVVTMRSTIDRFVRELGQCIACEDYDAARYKAEAISRLCEKVNTAWNEIADALGK